MKKMLVLAVVAVFAFSGSAMAVPVDPDPDGMSMYFDVGGETFCATHAGGFLPLTAHLLVTNASAPDVKAWEARLELDTNAQLVNPWVLSPGAVPVVEGNDYQVGTGSNPIPAIDGVAHLADITILFYGMNPPGTDFATYSVSGVPGSLAFPDGAGYAHVAGTPIPCQPIDGTWGACAWLNGVCDIIANEDT